MLAVALVLTAGCPAGPADSGGPDAKIPPAAIEYPSHWNATGLTDTSGYHEQYQTVLEERPATINYTVRAESAIAGDPGTRAYLDLTWRPGAIELYWRFAYFDLGERRDVQRLEVYIADGIQYHRRGVTQNATTRSDPNVWVWLDVGAATLVSDAELTVSHAYRQRDRTFVVYNITGYGPSPEGSGYRYPNATGTVVVGERGLIHNINLSYDRYPGTPGRHLERYSLSLTPRTVFKPSWISRDENATAAGS